MRILFADDDPEMRLSVEMLLRRDGHKVDAVEDGADLMIKLEAGEAYDVVVTDHDMPQMTGLQVLRAIKSDPDLKHLPVVILTGNDVVRSRVTELSGIYVEKGSHVPLLKALDKLKRRAA